MEWSQFLAIVSTLIGWSFVLTRQMLQRMDRLVESAQRQEAAITEEFITHLRQMLDRTDHWHERLEAALEEIQESLWSLRHLWQEWSLAQQEVEDVERHARRCEAQNTAWQ
jgi:predicted patatin/cPLA2 family phospholipase